jgi:hypothetical protein
MECAVGGIAVQLTPTNVQRSRLLSSFGADDISGAATCTLALTPSILELWRGFSDSKDYDGADLVSLWKVWSLYVRHDSVIDSSTFPL